LVVSINSYVAGVVEETRYEAVLRSLPSFGAIMSMPRVGETVYKTKDLFTSLGVIYLVHDEPEVMFRDLARIRELESANALLTIRGADLS
jgi:hypothetical protein